MVQAYDDGTPFISAEQRWINIFNDASSGKRFSGVDLALQMSDEYKAHMRRHGFSLFPKIDKIIPHEGNRLTVTFKASMLGFGKQLPEFDLTKSNVGAKIEREGMSR